MEYLFKGINFYELLKNGIVNALPDISSSKVYRKEISNQINNLKENEYCCIKYYDGHPIIIINSDKKYYYVGSKDRNEIVEQKFLNEVLKKI